MQIQKKHQRRALIHLRNSREYVFVASTVKECNQVDVVRLQSIGYDRSLTSLIYLLEQNLLQFVFELREKNQRVHTPWQRTAQPAWNPKGCT